MSSNIYENIGVLLMQDGLNYFFSIQQYQYE